MNLVSQLLPLLGVAVGALLSYVAAGAAARSHWQRQLSIRWDQERLAAFIEYANAAKMIWMAGLRIVAGRGLGSVTIVPGRIVPVDAEEGEALLAEAEARRSSAIEGVLLLGDTATIAGAAALTEQLWRLQAVVRSEDLTEETWRAVFVGYRQARADFYRHARQSMGVALATIPLAVPSVGTTNQPGRPAEEGDGH